MFILVKKIVLTYNDSMSLEQKVIQSLIDKNKTIALVESCTGGLLSHRLTNVPGSSACLKLSCVAYSNEAKQKLLKVPASLLKRYGAVSEQAVEAMAKNIKKIIHTDFAVAISGIAGPGGGTKAKPVGLVFICVAAKYETLTVQCLFKGTRLSVKNQAASFALKLLSQFLP